MDDRFLPVDASDTALLIHCAHRSAHLCMPHVTQRLRNRHRPREHSHHAETERDCNTRLQKEKVVDLSPKLNFISDLNISAQFVASDGCNRPLSAAFGRAIAVCGCADVRRHIAGMVKYRGQCPAHVVAETHATYEFG